LIPKNIIAKFDHYIEGNHGILIKTNNHDDFINQYRNDYKIIKINQKNILLCHSFNLNVNDIHHHGEKSDYVDVLLPFRNELIKNNNIDIVICGHTHNAYIQQRQDLLIINPGSLIYKNHLNQNTYVVGETTENGIDFVIKEYNL
jgi:putative phosphoesterase